MRVLCARTPCARMEPSSRHARRTPHAVEISPGARRACVWKPNSPRVKLCVRMRCAISSGARRRVHRARCAVGRERQRGWEESRGRETGSAWWA
eukprot:scaffold124840_cov39-Tisochrysis_lutea.AAC.1